VLGQEIGSINLRTDIVPMDDIEELTDIKDQRLIYAAYVPKIVKMFRQWLALMHLLPKFPEYDSEANAFQAFARLLVQDGSMVQDGIIRLPDLEDGFIEWYDFMIANKPGGPGMDEINALITSRSDTKPLIPSWLPEECTSLPKRTSGKLCTRLI
jgi:hypothetical protein